MYYSELWCAVQALLISWWYVPLSSPAGPRSVRLLSLTQNEKTAAGRLRARLLERGEKLLVRRLNRQALRVRLDRAPVVPEREPSEPQARVALRPLGSELDALLGVLRRREHA